MFDSLSTRNEQNPWSPGPASSGSGGTGLRPRDTPQTSVPAVPASPGGAPSDGSIGELFSHWADSPQRATPAQHDAGHGPSETVPRSRAEHPGPPDPAHLKRGGPPAPRKLDWARSPGDKDVRNTKAPADPCHKLTWRGIGNLRGNPPVRSEEPPNMAVVEDQERYEQVRAAATAGLAIQQKRAEGMKADGKVTDNNYWFAKVYSFVTKHELEYAENQQFYYPTYVMQSVRYFEQIYADNLAASKRGDHVESHWAKAFSMAAITKKTTDTTQFLRDVLVAGGLAKLVTPVTTIVAIAGQEVLKLIGAVLSLVTAMKAHIRFDLPRAEAWVYNSYYRHMKAKPEWLGDCGIHDTRLADFQPDFGAMSGVFERATEDMNVEIQEYASSLAALIPRWAQDFMMNKLLDADMQVERADTWARALELEKNPGAGPYMDDGNKLQGDVTTGDNMASIMSLKEPLRPSMGSSAEAMDDDDVRTEVKRRGESGLVTESVTVRIRMINGLLKGCTGDDDEAAILTLLRASRAAGDLSLVVDATGAYQLADSFHGDEYETLRALFIQGYYPLTNGQTAFSLIVRCMDGETAEWEEEMIADILVSRSQVDGRALIEQIGEHYEGKRDFNVGLNKVAWQLDGKEQKRVEERYGKSE